MGPMSWHKAYCREFGAVYSQFAHLGGEKLAPTMPAPLEKTVTLSKCGLSCFYADAREWANAGEALVNAFTNTAEDFKAYVEQFNFIGNKYIKFRGRVDNLRQLSNDELLYVFNRFVKIRLAFSSILWSSFILNDAVSRDVHRFLVKKTNNPGDYLHPPRKTWVAEMQEKAYAIKINGLTDEELKAFADAYAWFPCLDIHNPPWSLEEAKKFAQEARPPIRTKPYRALRLSAQEEALLEMAKELAFLKDQRDAFRRIGQYRVLPLFNEIAERMSITLGELSYASIEEITSFLNGKHVDTTKFGERRGRGFSVIFDGTNARVIDETISLQKRKTTTLKGEQKKIIRGIAAATGIAVGAARIVRGVQDLEKIHAGDVLVAVTTNPVYVPAFRKVVAIVTDEGGITCHAALVAREMGKPCVVGTRNATVMLKDGDAVEVNAMTGIVRKLKEGERRRFVQQRIGL